MNISTERTIRQIEKDIAIARRKADRAKYLFGNDMEVRREGEKLAMLYDALRSAKRQKGGKS